MTSIQLGPLTFLDTDTAGWTFSRLVDWWGGTGTKTATVERPNDHGAFADNRLFRTARAISFDASFRGATSAEAEAAFDELAAVGAETPVLMTVTTAAGATSRVVRVDLAPATSTEGVWLGFAHLDLIAPDPRRYADGAWQQTGPAVASSGLVWPAVWPLVWPGGGSSGRVILTNSGRAPSAPSFRLQGPFASALITCVETGARVGFNRPVPAGSVVEISGKRAVIDGQSDVSRWLMFREWGDVPRGASRTYQFDAVAGAGAVMQGKVDPAWW